MMQILQSVNFYSAVTLISIVQYTVLYCMYVSWSLPFENQLVDFYILNLKNET